MKGFPVWPSAAARYVCVASIVLLVSPRSSDAQVVRGKAVEFRSDLPVAQARITLLDDNQHETSVATTTDSIGRYAITIPAAGRYSIRFQRQGYDDFTSVSRLIGAADTVVMDLWPQANADLLDSLLRVVGPTTRTPEGRAFDRRLKSGLGHIIVRERIAASGYYDLEEVITKAFDGLQVRHYSGELTSVCYRGCCNFTVFKNGTRSFAMQGNRSKTSLIQMQSVLATKTDRVFAVELYVGQTEMPPEYFGETSVACGVLGYWTRAPG